MKTSLLPLIAILIPIRALAIDQSGPVILEKEVTVCRNPYDHVRSIDFVKHDPAAWVRFQK